jgi:hypothetical protein
MQLRHEKEIIRRNRLLKEKQFEECRLREFKEALDKEAVSKEPSYFYRASIPRKRLTI